MRTAIAALCAALLLAGGAAGEDTEDRATMAGLLEALAAVLPASLDDERFADPAQRERIVYHLGQLARNGALLEAHAQGREAGFGFLSRSLARDARDVLTRYEEGRADEARFLLHELTDACVACHSRLPDAQAHPIGRRLFAEAAVAELPPLERVRLEMATRQWDRALSTYENIFASSANAPADIDLGGELDSYLELALRVRRDPHRARRTFERLAAREDVPLYLRETLAAWIESLRELEAREPVGSPLAEARALVAAAADQARFPDDRRALVPFVAASGVLHGYVAEADRPAPALGEAYYLLGLIESHIGRSFWLSQTEDYLEAAIRVAPSEPTAEQAYELLEEFVASGYTGSAGGGLPPEVQTRLRALRSLIDGQQPT